MMIDNYILDVEINQISDGFFFGFIGRVLAKLDLSFGIFCPIFSFFFSIKMITNGWVVFDSDNGAPNLCRLFFCR